MPCCRHQAVVAKEAETRAAVLVEQLEAALREVRGRVEQRRADVNSQTSQGAVVKALMEARQHNKIDGIHGRLGESGAGRHTHGCVCRGSWSQPSAGPPVLAGDLGAIAKEYDIAVSTSCPALDYIVVETTSAAQRCIELLRQRQLGVATCLILEQQHHLVGAIKEKKQPPEGQSSLTGGVPVSGVS